MQVKLEVRGIGKAEAEELQELTRQALQNDGDVTLEYGGTHRIVFKDEHGRRESPRKSVDHTHDVRVAYEYIVSIVLPFVGPALKVASDAIIKRFTEHFSKKLEEKYASKVPSTIEIFGPDGKVVSKVKLKKSTES